MNAHAPLPAAAAPTGPHGRPPLDAQVLAIQNADVLAAIAGDTKGPADIAAATGRDPSNLRKTLDRLRREGLIGGVPGGPVVLTRAGADLRRRLALLDGDAPLPPAGFDHLIPLTWAELTIDPANPRHRSGLADAQIAEMAASIREEYARTGRGLITPPTVRPPLGPDGLWRINKGERRWRGWRMAAQLGWIPDDHTELCTVVSIDDAQALASAIVENLQRADLDPLEEAEAFAALADQLDPAAHQSPVAEICRQIGKSGDSGERYVQERLRVARTATPENKARFIESRRRAAHDAPDPDPFLWKHLRDSVKVPRHITALDKSPALRLLVLEMAALGGATWGADAPALPTDGGLIHQAIGVGLLTYWPNEATASLTQTACEWLESQGWRTAADDLLLAARTALIGEIGVAALAPGQQVSAELNLPAQAPAADPPPEGDPSGPRSELAGRSPVGEGAAATSEPGSPIHDPREDDSAEIPAYLRRLAGAAAADPPHPSGEGDQPKAGGGAAPPPAPAPRQPTPAERLILAEVAWRADIARGGDGFAPAFGFHGDPVALAMIPHWLLTRMGAGCTQVALTRHARDFLAGYYEGGLTPKDLDAVRFAAGKIDFNRVEQLRASGHFATPWLNPPSRPVGASEDEPPLPNTPTPPALPGDDAPAPDGALDGEAEERPASPSPNPQAPPQANLDPVALMRRALIGLWREARESRHALGVAIRAPVNSRRLHEFDAGDHALLAECADSLAEAIRHADPFIPAELRAALDAEARRTTEETTA